jgi:hypothetical protein
MLHIYLLAEDKALNLTIVDNLAIRLLLFQVLSKFLAESFGVCGVASLNEGQVIS